LLPFIRAVDNDDFLVLTFGTFAVGFENLPAKRLTISQPDGGQ
jgi:hypothetical protein